MTDKEPARDKVHSKHLHRTRKRLIIRHAFRAQNSFGEFANIPKKFGDVKKTQQGDHTGAEPQRMEWFETSAGGETRTHDLGIMRPSLYP
jgi:hypothetical protein